MKDSAPRSGGGFQRRQSPGGGGAGRDTPRQTEKKEHPLFPITRWENIDGKEKIKEWVKTGATEETLNWARSFGDYLAGKAKEEREEKRRLYGEPFSSGILRQFYSDLLSLSEAFDAKTALMLRPRLNYALGDTGGVRSKALATVIDAALEAIMQEDADEARRGGLKNLADILEMILSYHKASGGK